MRKESLPSVPARASRADSSVYLSFKVEYKQTFFSYVSSSVHLRVSPSMAYSHGEDTE